MPPEEDETPVLEGPDPRTWEDDSVLGALLADIRTLEDVYTLFDGRVAQDGMTGTYHEARTFLRALGAQAREQFALALLAAYGIEPGEDAGASPFASAGKPRAFGAESSPPNPGTLPVCP